MIQMALETVKVVAEEPSPGQGDMAAKPRPVPNDNRISETDIATARAAGTPVVAVTFGYTHAPVASFAPDATIDHYRELVPALEPIVGRLMGR